MEVTFSTAAAVLGAILAFLGAWLGYRSIDKPLRRGVYTEETASALLTQEKVHDWNAFQRLNPDWAPKLRALNLDGLSLQEADFRRADLAGASFRQSRLDGADFSEAILTGADFTGASLKRAVFDHASLQDARFTEALLDEASFVDANLQGVRLEEARGATRREDDRSTSEMLLEVLNRPELLSSLRPQEFERVVAELFHRLGYEVMPVSRASEGGVDILAVQKTPLGPLHMAIQVKRMSDPKRLVSVAEVRALYDLLARQKPNMAVLVTNGRFTPAARALADPEPSLRLVDGEQLAELVRRTV